MIAMFRPIENRHYPAWAGVELVSSIGAWMQTLAQDWLVLTVLTDHSDTAVGITTGNAVPPDFCSVGPLAESLPTFSKRMIQVDPDSLGLRPGSGLLGRTVRRNFGKSCSRPIPGMRQRD
ncbi:hypothetical protein [Arthrobacter sp. 135MFCol5.1]|uniref:hypothetical protein n=1 Tax=Arthrobacter sp. 135MFCol5.1 TaxID=1158050 RepID=UPI0003A184F6|nr:hypothetical protein [Arthrobacter sp. 135MFCol5.1]